MTRYRHRPERQRPARSLHAGMVLVVAPLILLVGLGVAAGESRRIRISTGSIEGLYYPVGGALATAVNAQQAGGVSISVLPSAGSEANLRRLLAGEAELGIVQSDRLYRAYKGEGDWKGHGAQTKLRAVMALHSEIVTLVVGSTSGILGIRDVKGKKDNIGEQGSGHRGNAIEVLSQVGIKWKTEILPHSLGMAASARAIADYRIDGAFFTIGHPNRIIRGLTDAKRKVHFVPLTGMDSLFKKYPYYTRTPIPVNFYPGVTASRNVRSIGVKAVLVTTTDVPAETIYGVTKGVLGNLKNFRLHPPTLKLLTWKGMVNGLLIPMHKGAKRYVKHNKPKTEDH